MAWREASFDLPVRQVGNLVPCIRAALLKGYIPTPILAPRIVAAGAQWLDWHHDFALNQLQAAAEADERLIERAASMDDTAEVFVIDDTETALQVRTFCRGPSPWCPVLRAPCIHA